MNHPIDQFFTKEPQGTCTDEQFEFGNAYRKNINCFFCINNVCHYDGHCDRRSGEDKNEGWRIN